MDSPEVATSRQGKIVTAAVGTVLLVIYGPVLAMGPVGEDLQWAFKGWVTWRNPASWFHPFHEHLRPAGRLFFVLGANCFGDRWVFYRLLVLGAAVGLAFLAGRFLSRSGRLPPWLAALGVLLWLGSPFADEVFFVTNQVKQVLYASGILLVLLSRRPSGRGRTLLAAGGAVLAFASKEEAVILPALVFLQDFLLFRISFRHALRRAVPWIAIALLYLGVYRSLVHFEAGWFYATPWLAGPNLATTWMAFWHLHPPVLGRYVETLRTAWPAAVGAGLLTVLVLTLSLRKGDRTVAFGFAAAVIALGPTLPANLQASRYTFLPFLFFTLAALGGGHLVASTAGRRPVAAALLLTLAAVVANDLMAARGDRIDWERYAALTTTLRAEAGPVLEAVRSGNTVVAVRGRDRAPLGRIMRYPSGNAKLFFPRPDDPYGVTSLQAIVCWELREEEIAARRLVEPEPPEPACYLVHDTGGFRKIPPMPDAFSRPFGDGLVILRPIPGRQFDPDVFP